MKKWLSKYGLSFLIFVLAEGLLLFAISSAWKPYYSLSDEALNSGGLGGFATWGSAMILTIVYLVMGIVILIYFIRDWKNRI